MSLRRSGAELDEGAYPPPPRPAVLQSEHRPGRRVLCFSDSASHLGFYERGRLALSNNRGDNKQKSSAINVSVSVLLFPEMMSQAQADVKYQAQMMSQAADVTFLSFP